MLALNLGSGQRPFKPPFVNYDIQVAKWKQRTLDAGCLWIDNPWEGPPYDVIVLHHCLEHFGCGEADALIRDCYDALRIGGSLLMFIPNMRILAQHWLTHQMDTQLFMTSVYGAYMGDESDRHKWGYDPESLREYLKKFSWTSVVQFNWREIKGADIAKDYWITGMECIK